mmetsp:Transcript_1143/g.1848  ORF Transcript_1143/g.1848 Transcript_1143/m.1848 type:complete len:98 (+) Transcript_1143:852-1145(+)
MRVTLPTVVIAVPVPSIMAETYTKDLTGMIDVSRKTQDVDPKMMTVAPIANNWFRPNNMVNFSRQRVVKNDDKYIIAGTRARDISSISSVLMRKKLI